MSRSSSPASFHLTLGKQSFVLFYPLLQGGVRVAAQVGGSLRGLLEGQFGLDPEYLRERIKTVFLDGKPVDDWDTTLVQDGSIIALSAAMPGLAGATLRRGGFFAGLRSQITHQESHSPGALKEGWVTVKLFNLLVPELGPAFLRRGILMSREEFAEMGKSLPDDFRREEDEEPRTGREGSRQEEWIVLSVQFPD